MNFEELHVDTCSTATLAAIAGNTEKLEELIKAGAATNITDNKGWRALHHACFKGHIECVKLLVNASDVDIDARSFEDKTALHITCTSEADPSVVVDIAKILLDREAEPNDEKYSFRWLSTLNQAITTCNLPLVKLLVERGANVSEKDDKHGISINAAVNTGDLEIVKYIASQPMDFSCMREDLGAHCFLHTLTYDKKDAQILLACLKSPHCLTEINFQDQGGNTALQSACYEGWREGIELLLDYGADANIRNTTKELPLVSFLKHVNEGDIVCPDGAFGKLVKLTSQCEFFARTWPQGHHLSSFYHLVMKSKTQYLVMKFLLDNFPSRYSSNVISVFKVRDTFNSIIRYRMKREKFFVSPLAYWCSDSNKHKNLNCFRLLMAKENHLNAATLNRIPPLIMAASCRRGFKSLNDKGPLIVYNLIKKGADVMSTIIDWEPLSTPFLLAFFQPTTYCLETLLINSVPPERLFSDEKIHEICMNCLYGPYMPYRGRHLYEYSSAMFLRSVTLISKFLPKTLNWATDMLERAKDKHEETQRRFRIGVIINKVAIISTEEERERCEDDFQKAVAEYEQIIKSPVKLWHLAATKVRTTLWNKRQSVPICICVEELCREMNLPSAVEELLLFKTKPIRTLEF